MLNIAFLICDNTDANPEGTNIVISEVLYDAPNSDAEEEWIELYNPTDSTILIDGWTLSDNVGDIVLTGSIDVRDHFVIARNEVGFYQLYSFNPDFTEGFALSNTGDLLNLTDSQGNNVDFVAWENSVSGWNIEATDTTIRRKNSLDTDTVDDWEDSHSEGDPGVGIYPPPTITSGTSTTTSTPTTSIDTTITTTMNKSTEIISTATTKETLKTSKRTSLSQTSNSTSLSIIVTLLALLLIINRRQKIG